MSLTEKLIKNSTIKSTSMIANSDAFNKDAPSPTVVPMVNVALSGSFDGGLTTGITTIAGPSRHFKSTVALLLIRAYLDKHKDAVVLFYDSEFGSPEEYFKAFNIDTSRIVHTPVMNIEELKFDLVTQLETNIEKKDKVIILIDSIGNLASKKEIADALDGSSKADMTRAKQLKSLYRMITPYMTMKQVPLVQIAHTYDTQEMFSKKVVSGGTGIMYSSDNIWIMGRQQEKEGKDLAGYKFIINVEKSRFVKEKSKIPIEVSFKGGLRIYGGLLDVAVESGHVVKPSMGWYTRPCVEDDGKFREKQTRNEEFWKPVLEQQDFRDFVKNKYKLVTGSLIQSDDIDMETGEINEY